MDHLPTSDAPRRLIARAERISFALWDAAAGSTPLALPPRKEMRLAGMVVASFFVVFAGILWAQIAKVPGLAIHSVFDLSVVLFSTFWILGWSVGVLFLGALTILLLCYGESARIAGGRLIRVPRLGPLKILVEYDLARIRNLRLEHTGKSETVRVRFDYGAGSAGLGDAMPRDTAATLIAQIRGAAPASIMLPVEEPAATMEAVPLPTVTPHLTIIGQPLWSPATLALIAANLVPVAGVLLYGWELAAIMVLFWAESAVIGFYTVLKMAIVGKWAALFPVPFFIAHYGAFMTVHFLFLYEMFVRGPVSGKPEPGAWEVLAGLLVPLLPALTALFISHGISFAVNFIARREFEGETVSALMGVPYRRIMMMQVTIIFGGWILMALHTPTPALLLLIVLKLATDMYSHSREHTINNM